MPPNIRSPTLKPAPIYEGSDLARSLARWIDMKGNGLNDFNKFVAFETVIQRFANNRAAVYELALGDHPGVQEVHHWHGLIVTTNLTFLSCRKLRGCSPPRAASFQGIVLPARQSVMPRCRQVFLSDDGPRLCCRRIRFRWIDAIQA